MPSTRARTWATRYAEVRPGSSAVIGTLLPRTVTTETSGGGDVVACFAEPQAARITAATATAITRRHRIIGSASIRHTIRVSMTPWSPRFAAGPLHVRGAAFHLQPARAGLRNGLPYFK